MSMNNTPAQLYLFNVTSHTSFGVLHQDGCGFVLAAYDELDALETVEEFVGERMSKDIEHEPVMFLGLAPDEIEHGMIMSHIPDYV